MIRRAVKASISNFGTYSSDGVVASTIVPPVISLASAISHVLNSFLVEERIQTQPISCILPFAGKGWVDWRVPFRDRLYQRMYETGHG